MQKNNIAVLEKEIAAAQATQDKIAIKDISSMRLELEIAKRNLAQAEKALADMNKNWIKDWAIEEAWQQLKQSGDIAWQQTLKFFLNTLAYDTATYLATGDKGQMPMFETEGWAGYLQNTADNAAGTFLETLGSSGPIKFNLCNPDPRVMMKINLGLMRTFRPKAPPCTFSTLVNNWEEALNDKDFLNKFQDMFNPWSNDLGIALTLQTGIESQVSREINNAAQDRIEGQGWRPVRSAIEGRIQTPADIVGAAARQPVSDSTASEKIHTGTILADSIDIFINTLAGKLMGQWLKKGLITDFPRLTNRLDSLSDPYGQRYNEGISGAENRFAGLTEPNFKVRGDYDILAELTTCPDPNKAGPTNCVIDEKFRQAIEKKLTVGQALKQGYLNGNGIFGFTSDGLEPRYNEGYPYRSMLILRKFRIIPLGWEIAAQKIKDQQSEVRGTKNLRDLVDCFADASQTWCYGLVDPDWVLEAPQNFCAAEGAGPEIMSEQITGQGADSQLAILRNDSYCADEQSCVKEKADGSCQQYGYCAEERRTWDFNANSCEPRDNTCQTFSSPAGEQVSYLKNTLDYGVCGAGNAGCAKYATGGTYADGAVNWSASPSIYLNQSAQTCEAADDGCSALIRQSGQTIYEKLLPDYLVNKVNGNRAAYDEGDCYDSQGRLLLGAPAKCSNFARMCAPAEAGCELYTGVNDGMKIPAQTDADDACPAECVGYNQFVQAETYFDLSRAAYFIPQTAKTCSAEAAGCEQFTNLDEQARGGEGIEYYSYLRQCVKPDKPDQPCGAFYSWEGSDESGYQLKNYQLKQNPDDKELPYTVDGPAQCAYGLAPGDDGYEANKDCREFYSRNGRVSYYIFDKTVSCTDDCHPYRQTVSAGPETCSGGGVWSEENKACLYMAVPDQGRTCSAAASGCREYAGNTGNDVRIIFTDNFDATGTVGEWSGAVAAASESLTLGSGNLGRSIKISGDAQRPVGTSVSQGKSYVLRFLAKTESGEASLNLALANDTASAAFSQSVGVNKNWQVKEANLAELDHEVTANEVLYLSFASGAGQKVYLDDITLTEITDRYYLIKDTWRDNCDYLDADPTKDTVSETFYSGCSAYTDRANKNYYLTQFDKLCSESSVGCELMTDTHNSTDNTASYYLSGNKVASCDPLTEPACVEVLADSQIYAVYDPSKSCSAQAKGCSLLGKEYKYGSEDPIYGDVYLKNDPDKYNTALCGAEAVGCKTYAYDGGETYFKDPGDQICEWRQEQDAGSGASSYGWYKKKVKRCGGAGAVCLADKDCSGVTCIPETTSDENLKCDTTDNKTLGLGGVGGKVSQPSNWAGTCSAAASGCTEYLDPLSQFNTNLIFNGSFADLDNLSSTANDGWESGTTACPSGICQNVTLKPNTVYRLARLKRDNVLPGTLSISCSAGTALYGITENNELTGPDNATSTPVKNYETSKTFYYRGSADASCTITAGSSAGAVELKKAVIDYQLAQNLDKQSCNGVVDFNKGCVLFNQRSQNGDYLAPLKWDADTGDIGGNIANAEKDSNLILKVAPDRVCGQWLACRSYIKDENGKNVCFDVGLCDAVDENGNCSSFINSPEENQIVGAADGQLSADNISNLSGYAKAGLPGGSLGGDYYPFGAMTQIGETANLSNGGFEFYGSNLYPVGWSWSGADKSWNTNVFSVINNPIRAQAEGIGYAPEGRVFLKLGSSYIAESEGIDVMPNTPYIITAYVNTKNLKSGQAKIDIKNSAGADIKQAVIWQDIGNDWQFKLGEFSSGGNSRIKIQLSASAVGARPVSEGNFYFDDIKIRPALESKCLESDGDCKTTPYNAWNTTQSCRLYPQSDSLACDYYEDSG
ncbi:MAG: hypothetical protein Q8O93_02970, partial [bacterium]|nr:hypothetical protein [bacterium]